MTNWHREQVNTWSLLHLIILLCKAFLWIRRIVSKSSGIHILRKALLELAWARTHLQPANPITSTPGLPHLPVMRLQAQLSLVCLRVKQTKRVLQPLILALNSVITPVSYTHLRAHETPEPLVCRLLLEKK